MFFPKSKLKKKKDKRYLKNTDEKSEAWSTSVLAWSNSLVLDFKKKYRESFFNKRSWE